MNRRKLLAAAIVALFATGAAGANAGENYRIGDAGVIKASATEATTSTANADLCDECNVCDPCCCASSPWFVEVEGLLWWRKSRPLPPLVTTSSVPDQGVLGAPSTVTLFGGQNYNDGPAGGGRINFGRWLDADQTTGVGANFFMLGQEEIDYTRAAASPFEILAIPFFDVNIPGENSLVLNNPGVNENGRVNIRYQNDVMGADAYLRRLVYAEDNVRIEFIGGYQFARIDDGLTINANFDDPGVANANLDATDSFSAKNEFHGGSLGVLTRLDNGRWRLTGLAKCGLGNMHQTVTVSGQEIATPLLGGPATIEPTGLFVQPSNSGTFSNDEFAIIPEAKLNVGYRATENWTFGVGYSFIYYSDIMTAGNAIDRNLDLAPPNAVPAPPDFARTSDFWVQGVNFSAEFAY